MTPVLDSGPTPPVPSTPVPPASVSELSRGRVTKARPRRVARPSVVDARAKAFDLSDTVVERWGWWTAVFMAALISAMVTWGFTANVEEPAPMQSIATVSEDWTWKIEPVSLDKMIRSPSSLR